MSGKTVTMFIDNTFALFLLHGWLCYNKIVTCQAISTNNKKMIDNLMGIRQNLAKIVNLKLDM